MAALTDSEVSLMKRDGRFASSLFRLLAGALFWGLHATIFVFALYCMSFRPKSRARLVLMLTISILFLASTFLLGNDCFFELVQVAKIMISPEPWALTEPDRVASSWSTRQQTEYVEELIMALEFLLGDAIVIWRTWVVWQGGLVMSIPILFWIASLGTVIAERLAYMISGDYAAMPQSMVLMNISIRVAGFSLSIATNAISTAMITYKAWKYRRFIRYSLGSRGGPTAVERVLALLVESGFVYLCFWGLAIITQLDIYSDRLIAFANIWVGISYQATGLYPTAIAALVELQRSLYNDIEDSFHSVSLPVEEADRPAAVDNT